MRSGMKKGKFCLLDVQKRPDKDLKDFWVTKKMIRKQVLGPHLKELKIKIIKNSGKG